MAPYRKQQTSIRFTFLVLSEEQLAFRVKKTQQVFIWGLITFAHNPEIPVFSFTSCIDHLLVFGLRSFVFLWGLITLAHNPRTPPFNFVSCSAAWYWEKKWTFCFSLIYNHLLFIWYFVYDCSPLLAGSNLGGSFPSHRQSHLYKLNQCTLSRKEPWLI